MKKIFSLLLILLSGCKVETYIDVTTDQLTSNNPPSLIGSIYFEVPSCSDYEDSRLESSSLIEIKEKVPTLFNDATYKECFKQKMESFAHFEIPVSITANENERKTDLTLFSNDYVLIGVLATNELINRLKAENEKSLTTLNHYFYIDVEFNEDFVVDMYSFYIDGVPIPFGSGLIEKGKKHSFSLSDVSIDQLLEQGHTLMLMYKK